MASMKTGHKGDLSELIVLTELLRLNKEVAIPYGNRPGYDLLVKSSDGSWKRLQVKTAYSRTKRGLSTYCDFLRGSGKGKRRFYTKDDFDFLIAVRQDKAQMWVFPISQIVGRRCTTVGMGSAGFMEFDLL